MASPDLFREVVEAVKNGADAAIPGLRVTDTVKRVREGAVVTVEETLSRDHLVTVQTPQAFRRDVLERAHEAQSDATDDAALVEVAGGQVVVVPGEIGNIKITEAHDLDTVNAALERTSR